MQLRINCLLICAASEGSLALNVLWGRELVNMKSE